MAVAYEEEERGMRGKSHAGHCVERELVLVPQRGHGSPCAIARVVTSPRKTPPRVPPTVATVIAKGQSQATIASPVERMLRAKAHPRALPKNPNATTTTLGCWRHTARAGSLPIRPILRRPFRGDLASYC
jgi:hypothetical protein